MDRQGNEIIRVPADKARSWRAKSKTKENANCSNCPSRQQCLPGSLEPHEIKQFEHIIYARQTLQDGTTLLGEYEKYSSVFAIRSGMLKLAEHSANERQHISGFAFPGDILLGYDGLGSGINGSDAVALGNCTVCEIPFEALCELGEVFPNLLSACLQMISKRIISEQKLAKLLTEGSANQRVSRFMLMMTDDFNPYRRSENRFTAPMSREDIGSYLKLPVNTLNSLLEVFERHGLISINEQDYLLIDRKSLREMAYGVAGDHRTS